MVSLKKKHKKQKLPDDIIELISDLEFVEVSQKEIDIYTNRHNKAKSKLQQIKQKNIDGINYIKKKMKKTSRNYLNKLRGKK